jgi:hypothetical protein
MLKAEGLQKAEKGNGFDANSANFTNLEGRSPSNFDLPSSGSDAPSRRDFKGVLALARQVFWSKPPTRPRQMKMGGNEWMTFSQALTIGRSSSIRFTQSGRVESRL